MSSSQPAPASISERRMAKYKEERRRQLASQIANRLSSNQSSSSSDENEDSNSSLEKFAKYRRHHRSKKEAEIPAASKPDEAAVPPVVSRRRRRRSITKESASPARGSPRVKAKLSVHNDADGEDDDDREDSPEHIYHQIGTTEVIRVKKQDTESAKPRQPRLPSKDKPIDTGEAKQKVLAAESSGNTANDKRKSMLNTSYSSEEILLQAASSLQGLEGNHYLCLDFRPSIFVDFVYFWTFPGKKSVQSFQGFFW